MVYSEGKGGGGHSALCVNALVTGHIQWTKPGPPLHSSPAFPLGAHSCPPQKVEHSNPPGDPQPLSCAVSLLCIQLVVTPATSEQFPKREWGHPACNPGLLWEELRFAPALRLPQASASANEAVAEGAASRGALDIWPGLWRWGPRLLPVLPSSSPSWAAGLGK